MLKVFLYEHITGGGMLAESDSPPSGNLLREGKFVTYTMDENLAGNGAYSIHEDGEGVVWVGTDSGVTRLENGKAISYTRSDGLASDFVVFTPWPNLQHFVNLSVCPCTGYIGIESTGAAPPPNH